ncbi:hyoscyamine 6-dioxygenase-like [Silene latifolia]|uniref:hyoscyamine 6-dioxygenase-like n=1 Tax=Silene latifolia TaxID=37657 RepID=UPI003D772183
MNQIIEKHVSTWADGKTFPASYVVPSGKRPGDNVVPTVPNIPVIDLSKSQSSHRKEIVQQIIEAAQHFGFFQVINHGVPWRLMDDAIGVFKEFFELPSEEKSRICLEEQSRKFSLFTSSSDYDKETHHFWRDATTHSCTPLEECIQYWPSKPLRYREVVGNYVVNVRELGSRLLELISEGLGLEHGYFAKELSQEPVLVANHYPPCPDPSLTLGAGKHCDPNLITILLQEDVPGLQFVNNGEWISVEPIPYAFVVNIGLQLQIISNGKLRSMEHRVVTNAVKSRTTSAYFIEPRKECFIEPAKAVLSAENPSNYKGVLYKELVKITRAAFIE